MTDQEITDIETHVAKLQMPGRINFNKASWTDNPAKIFQSHACIIRGTMAERSKKPYEDRLRVAYQAVLKHNGL